MSFDAAFFTPLPDGAQVPATQRRVVAFQQSRHPQRVKVGRQQLHCHAYLATVFTLRGRYTMYLYLVSADPGTNAQALLTAPATGATISQYAEFAEQARRWLAASSFEMVPVDLERMSGDMRQATLGVLPFAPAKGLGPEPHELPDAVQAHTPPNPLRAVLQDQPPEALLERLRQGMLRA
jgi:hypothetical protein